MKVRKGFVSNSSSSSFVCDVCGEIESGWDLSFSDCDMLECERGHIYHRGCLSKEDLDLIENSTNEDDIDNEDYSEQVKFDICPVCQLRIVTDDMINDFLFMKSGKSKKEISDSIKSEFKNADDLKDNVSKYNKSKNI